MGALTGDQFSSVHTESFVVLRCEMHFESSFVLIQLIEKKSSVILRVSGDVETQTGRFLAKRSLRLSKQGVLQQLGTPRYGIESNGNDIHIGLFDFSPCRIS